MMEIKDKDLNMSTCFVYGKPDEGIRPGATSLAFDR